MNGKKPEYELKERTKTMKIKTNAKTSVTLAAALLICGANAAAQNPAFVGGAQQFLHEVQRRLQSFQ